MRYNLNQTCVHCKEEKLLEDFYFRSTGHISRICKPCNTKKTKRYRESRKEKIYFYNRNRALKIKFGISLEEYEKLFKEQNGVCKICKTNEQKRQLAVDHCHDTGKIRGLLCSNCNIGLGNFKDNENLLFSAIVYLKENSN